MAKAKFVTDSVWEGIFNHLAEGAIISPNAILVFCELDKVIDSLAVMGKRDCYYCILVIVLW